MHAPPLVGRDAELEALRQALEATQEGRGSLWFACGEAGIGKSRLAEELADHAAAQGLTVLWGRCWEAGGAPAYWPWIQVLRGLLKPDASERALTLLAHHARYLLQLLPEFAERWGEVLEPPALGAERERFELLDAIGAVVCDVPREQAVLLILEDLHMADVSSLSAFEVLSPRLKTSKVCVLGTYREAQTRAADCRDALLAAARQGRVLALGRLDRPQVQQFLRARANEDLSEPVGDLIFEATEGNPLFLNEVTRLLGTQSAWQRVASAGVVIPGNLRYTLRRRVESLPELVRRALEVACVLGREFSGTLLSALWGRSMAETALPLHDALEAAMIIEAAPGEYRFSHVLLREVLHQGLADSERTQLHLDAAELLSRRKPDALTWSEIAHHYLEAGAAGRSGAVDACERAAHAAAQQWAFSDAGEWYSRALTALGQDPSADLERRCRLLLQLGAAEIHSGAIQAGKETCLRGAALARELEDAALFGEAALTYGSVLVFATVDDILVRLLAEALERLDARDSAARAILMARLAAAEQPAADPEGPIALAREALAMAGRLDDERTWLETARYAVSALMDLGPPGERLRLNREYLRVAKRLGQPLEVLRGQMRLTFDCFELGDLASAELAIEAIEAQAEQLGHPFYAWRAHSFRAMSALFQGRFEQAESHRQRAKELGERARDPNVRRVDLMQRYGQLKLQGRFEELYELRHDLPAAFQSNELLLRVYSSEAHLLGGHGAQAAALIRPEDLELMLSVGDLTLVSLLIELSPVMGGPELLAWVTAQLEQCPSRFVSGGMTLMLWQEPVEVLRARCAAKRGHAEQAVAHWKQAIEAAEQAGAGPFAAWFRVELAEHLLAQGASTRDQAVQELLHAAQQTAEGLGMPGLVQRVDVHGVKGTTPVERAWQQLAQPPGAPASLEREGELWVLRSGDRTLALRESKGLQWLAELMRRPGEEVHVLALMAPGAAVDRGDAGEHLDQQAVNAYRQRARELQQELDEAEAFNDSGRVERCKTELQFIEQELSRAVGLGNRARRAGAQAERARINVQRRLRDAIGRISAQDPVLGQHFERAVTTGVFCSYRP